MKMALLFVFTVVISMAAGIGVSRLWLSDGGQASVAAGEGERKVLYWKAPMDPNYRRDQPGKSPMGMDLVPVYADEAGEEEPGVVSIDPTVVSNLGVRTATAERGVLSQRIETVGYIGYDEDTLHQINTRVDGWIEKLSVKATGDPVKRGQALFELYSPTLVNAQEEFLATLNSRTKALVGASRERLKALGVTNAEIKRLERERTVRQRIRVFAQTDGFVAHLGIREGVYVTPKTEVMAIAELDRVWVLAEVFERQSAWVQPGQTAEVELDYLPGERWQGTVDYVYPELDAKTRTLKVRLRFDNAEQVLRPNMFARVTIFGTETDAIVHVPREALIRGGKVNRVVLALGEGRFRSQPVDIGMESGDRVEIRRGLAPGEPIVTSGQFLIDSESNIDVALARMAEGDQEAPRGTVDVTATVRNVAPAERTVTLEHPAIPAWQWPAMTMSFGVADGVALDAVSAGDAVEITIERHSDSHYQITSMAPAADPTLAPTPSGSDDASMDRAGMDHSQMNHGQTDDEADPGEMDHSKMDHSQMDHGDMSQEDDGGESSDHDDHEGHTP